MVASGVQEDSRVIPASTLHTHILMHCTQTVQLTVADGQSWRERDEEQLCGVCMCVGACACV